MGIDFLAEAEVQLFSMLVEPLRLLIHRLPKNVAEDSSAIDELIEQLDFVDMALVRIVGEDASGNNELVRFVRSARCVVACSLLDEVSKPSTEEVRRARKNILALADSQSTGRELGMVMTNFAGAKSLMAKAKDHCAGCLADQNATELYEIAASRFEKGMGAAFDDLQGWLMKGNAGSPHDCNSSLDVMSITSTMAADALNSLSMWSTAALRRHLEILGNLISVGMEVVRLWIIVEARAVESALRVAFSSLGQASDDGTNPDAHLAAAESAGSMDETLADVVAEGSGVAGLTMGGGHGTGASQADGNTPSFTAAPLSDAAALERALRALLAGADHMRSLVEAIRKCYDVAKQRAGAMFTDMVEDRCLPQAVKNDCEIAFDSLQNLMNYTICAIQLVKSQVDDSLNFGCALDLGSEHFDCLAMFCKAHEDHLRRSLPTIDMQFDPIVPFASVARPLANRFNKFVDKTGQDIFDAHSTKSMNFWLQKMLDDKVTINAVHGDRLHEMSADKMFPLLVPAPPLDKLLPPVPSALEEDTNNQNTDYLSQNRALKMLLTFAERVGFLDIVIPGVHFPDKPGDQPLPLDLASFVLSTICVSIDCSIFAAILHQHLLKPMCDSEDSDTCVVPADPFGSLTDALLALNTRLVSLDSLARPPKAGDFEKAGYQSTFIQIMTIANWVTSMSAYAKRAENFLLNSWAELLRSAIKQTREVCPSWDAAFENSEFQASLAQKILAGKVANFVNAHNRLHSMLTKATSCATNLEIQPRLAEHECTCEVVAVASSTLGSMKTGAMSSQGVDILANFKSHPDGSEYARLFIEKHKAAATSTVPPSFWHQFESLAAHASLSDPIVNTIATKVRKQVVTSPGKTSAASASLASVASVASVSTTASSSSGAASAGVQAVSSVASGEHPTKLRRLIKKTSS